jgi:hypothetical protein
MFRHFTERDIGEDDVGPPALRSQPSVGKARSRRIFAAVFGPQRTWMLLVVAGFVQLSAGLSVLSRRSSSVIAWVALAVGIVVVAAGIRIAFTP